MERRKKDMKDNEGNNKGMEVRGKSVGSQRGEEHIMRVKVNGRMRRERKEEEEEERWRGEFHCSEGRVKVCQSERSPRGERREGKEGKRGRGRGRGRVRSSVTH